MLAPSAPITRGILHALLVLIPLLLPAEASGQSSADQAAPSPLHDVDSSPVIDSAPVNDEAEQESRPPSAFEQGVSSYRQGRYEEALAFFLEAEALGMQGPNLRFNLGLTYYKLGRHAEAQASFEGLLDDPRYRPLAEYQLALVAARSGDRPSALKRLRSASQSAPNARLRRLARTTAARLQAMEGGAEETRYFSLGRGYDSNPTLLDDQAQREVAAKGDAYNEFLGVFSTLKDGDESRGTWLEGSFYLRKFSDISAFDQLAGQLGLRWQRQGPRWRSALVAQGETSMLDGEVFQNGATLGFDLGRAAVDRTTVLHYRSTRLSSAAEYRHLDGWRHRVGIRWGRRFEDGRLRLAYLHERNDRTDLVAGDEFFSQSPIRHSVEAQWSKPISNRWSIELGAVYRDSRYAAPDRYLDAGTLREKRRMEELAEGSVGLRYRASRKWNLLMQYQHQQNEASFDRFAYERHAGVVALEWLSVD